MATVEVCNYTALFVKSKHIATSYRLIDGDTNKLIDQNLYDKVNKLKWTSPLADGKGKHFRNLKNLKAEIRFHYEGEDSRWFPIGEPYDQTGEPPIIHACQVKLN